MATNEFDAEDVGMFTLAVFAAASMVGIAEVSAFGVAMSDSFTIAGYTASLAWIVAIGTFAVTIYTNDHTDLLSADAPSMLLEDDSMDDFYAYAILAAAALLIGWVFIPQVESFVTSEDLWSVAYVGVYATSHVGIGWIR